jgi:hypothetical protein
MALPLFHPDVIFSEIEEPYQSSRALNCGIESFVLNRAAEYLCFQTMCSNYEKWNRK